MRVPSTIDMQIYVDLCAKLATLIDPVWQSTNVLSIVCKYVIHSIHLMESSN